MLGPLQPDPDQFRSAYPGWLKKVSALMAESANGTTFGIFGPWGSGKTSATKALQRDVLHDARAPLQDEDTIAVAYVDCSKLQSASAQDVSSSVQGELNHSGVTKRSLEVDSWIFTFFKKTFEVSEIGITDPLNKVFARLAVNLAAEGQRTAEKRKRKAVPQVEKPIEKAFVFLDDLDRCDADVAWAILRHAHLGLPNTKTVFAIVCDPVILGHHISHALGVPLASGFQAVLKYIDVPLRIPIALTDSHMEKIRSRIGPHVSPDWHLHEIARDAVGSIPVRDILVALPQASFWLESWDTKLRPTEYGRETRMRDIAEVVFFGALLQVCVPNAAQAIASGRQDEFVNVFHSISSGYLGPMKDSTRSAVERDYGGTVQEVLESRMDLVKYARSRSIGNNLDNIKVNEQYVWYVLWDMMRG